MPDSDETSGQCNKTCLDDTYSAQLIAGNITCQFEDDLSSVRKSKSCTQRYSASGWRWMNLRLCKAFEREKISSVFSSFPDLPDASSVGSLSHATLPICVRRSVFCIHNMSTFRAFSSLCVSLCFSCTLVHSNSPTTSTDSLPCIAGASTKQLSDLPLSKTCAAHVSDIVIEHTRIPQQ